MRPDLTCEDQFNKSALPICAQYLANNDDCHVDMVSVVADLLMQSRDCLSDITISRCKCIDERMLCKRFN